MPFAVALSVLFAGTAAAQRAKRKTAYWKTDPYTDGNDAAAMKKAAGYVSYGPFPWGDDHDTNDIKRMFPAVPFLFVETKHFKIASSLTTYKLPKGRSKKVKLQKTILAGELERLKKLFPKVKPETKTLDPWLRLHLFALRLEETYSDFCKRIGVKDEDFPKEGSVRISTVGIPKRFDGGRGQHGQKRDMGQGPYLGMRGKFLVLLTTKGGYLNRYAARAKGGLENAGEPMPQRHYFTKVGSLFFGTACECGRGSLWNDHALHCHVVFNTVHSLVDGYKDFFFSIPVWNREGLAHWYLLRIDPEEHCFTGIKGRSNKQRYTSKWGVSIKKRLRHDDFTRAEKVMKYMSFDELTFGDHMAIWSRMDFLQSLGTEKFGKYLGIMKNRIEVPAGQQPKLPQILARQEQALKEAYGFDYAGFDAAWKEFVLARYPNR